MNEKFFLGLEDNFEVESRMIEFGVKPMTFNDLSEIEKAELFFDTHKLIFSMEDALELIR
jgi:hypothetical protein